MKFLDLIRIGVRGLAAAALLPAVCVADPLMTNTPTFRIPFVVDSANGQAPQGTAILFSSVNGAPLEQVQRVNAAVGGFDFSAPSDGRYAFAVRMTDRYGQLQNEASPLAPELEVIVDTLAPAMDLRLTQTGADSVNVAWSCDSPVTPGSVRIEYAEGTDGRWQQLEQATEATGNLQIRTSSGTSLSVRGFLTDLAGNEGTGTGQLVLSAASPVRPSEDPNLAIPVQNAAPEAATFGNQNFVMGQSPFAGQRQRIATPISESAPASGHSAAPIIQNSPVVGTVPPSTPTNSFSSPTVPVTNGSSPAMQPVPQPQSSHQFARNCVFDIAYQVEDVGPSGVGAVELFVTENNGQQWFRYGKDLDLQSPVQVDTRGEGTFGFAIRVYNGLGFGDPPPQPGEVPSIVVTVDSTPPTVRLGQPRIVSVGTGQIQLTWKVSEKNPAATPVRLEYATNPSGPWTPLFDWQQDQAGYQMPIQPGLAGGIYFRVLARDAAGNVATAQTTEPVIVDQTRPRARLLRIDPPAYQKQF